MGLFSKFNFKAVDQAYKDLVALQFVAMVAAKTLDACEYAGMGVDVGPICDDIALTIGNSLSENADGSFELYGAVSRLETVSRSIKRDLITKFGHDHPGEDIASELHLSFEAIAPRILKAAKKGYLKFSIMDAGAYIQLHENIIEKALHRTLERAQKFNTELEQRTGEELAEQSYSDEQLLTEIDRQYEEINIGLPDRERQTPEEFVKQFYQTIEREGGKIITGEGKTSPPNDSNEEANKPKQISKNSADIDIATADWLRGEYEFLQRKRAKGRELDEYERGLERQYEELQSKNGMT